MATAAGTRFNHYAILTPLGAGGMGEVYLAEDTRLHRKVALKLLPAEFTRQPERVRRFEQEACAASALNHPNILTIHEVGQANGTHFIATEFIDGQTLRARLTREHLSLTAALDIAIQAANALAAAHEAGIVHRDIKPENVMLRRDGIVKVLDFGLAKLTEHHHPAIDSEAPTIAKVNTDPGMVVGTANYMSPEQARGQEVDARSDIFSLGVVLYEMIAARAPFTGVNALEVIGEILKTEPPLLKSHAPDLPAELQRIVAKALRKDRDARYQHITDLLLDLKDLRQELEFAAKLKGLQAQSDGELPLTAAQQKDAVATNEVIPHTTSSSELLLGEIKRHKKGVALFLVVAVLAAVGGGYGLYRFIKSTQPRVAAAPMRVIPFTTYPGNQGLPAFSPDGNQIAFVWDGEKGDNADIYVKLVDGGTPLRLTTQPGQDVYPVWAPDGRSIAFYRFSPEGKGYYRIPALGGVERLLAELKGGANGFSWTSDGKLLIAAEKPSAEEPVAIYSIAIDTGERKKLVTAPQGKIYIYPTVSPDGKSILFYQTTNTVPAENGGLYVAAIGGGEPRQVVPVKNWSGHTWSVDGSEIIYSAARASGSGLRDLWRVPVAGGNPELVPIGANAGYPIIARQGERLAFTQSVNETDIYRMPVPKPGDTNGPPSRFISSTLNESSPRYSPDGKRIVFASNRSGSQEIWVCDAEGLNAVQLTSFGNGTTGTPRWSPDSRKIVFDARPRGLSDIYVIGADGGAPRQLTTEPSEDMVPSWSHDGRWIYFCSDRGGSLQVWKLPAEGGQAIQLTKQGGFEGFESADGKFFYYLKKRLGPGIWKVPTEGGEETLVVETDKAGRWRNWALIDKGIYFSNSDQPDKPVIEFFNFATGKVTKLTTFDRPINGQGIALSPDGRWLIFALVERQRENIMLVENFR